MCAATHYHDEMGKKGLVMFMYIVDLLLENFLKLFFFFHFQKTRSVHRSTFMRITGIQELHCLLFMMNILHTYIWFTYLLHGVTHFIS